MKKAIILSIPHSGTHFMMHLCQNVIGFGNPEEINVEYCHFQPLLGEIIRNRLENFNPHTEQIVIPYRPEPKIRATWKARLEQKGADWWGSRLDEYKECWDVKDSLANLLNETGFMLFPIEKSPMRHAYCEWLRERLLGRLNVEDYRFIEEWPPAKSWDIDNSCWRESLYYDLQAMKELMGLSLLKEK